MKNKLLPLFSLLLAFCAGNVFSQCVIPISEGQSYIEDFESGSMECWTVESTGNATWAVMNGTASNVVAFQNASNGDAARLISPTFDFSGVGSATLSFGYAMMALYNNDVLTVSYRTSETDSWHDLGSYSINDWANVYEETYDLPNISSTYQISFLGQSNGGYYIFIDNIEITGAGGCARPVNVEANEITAFSTLLSWSTTGNEESWIVELNGHPQNVDTQPFLMDGLMPQSEYTVQVKALCGGGLESEWSYPMTFQTLCDVIVVTDDAPYFDDFEASEDFICWHNEISLGVDGWVIDPGYTILNNTAFFIWMGGEAALISAPLDITAVTNPTLSFRHKQKLGLSYGTVDQLIVGYRTNENDSWHTLLNFTEATEDWETVEIALPDPSATYQITFDGIGHDAEGIYVDDVRVGNGNNVGIDDEVETHLVDGEAEVFDLFGRKVTTVQLRSGRIDLETSDLAPGVYIARIPNDKGFSTVKIIKE